MKGTEDLHLVKAEARHIDQVRTLWVAVTIFRSVRDKAWSYRLFRWDLILAHPAFESFSADDPEGRAQGFLAVSRQQKMLKVDFVAAAPWNYGPERVRRGVGAGLISTAITMSVAAGLGGALTLDSTPESETFYEKLRFERTGARTNEEDLAVFTLSAERSQALLRSYPAIAPRPKPDDPTTKKKNEEGG